MVKMLQQFLAHINEKTENCTKKEKEISKNKTKPKK